MKTTVNLSTLIIILVISGGLIYGLVRLQSATQLPNNSQSDKKIVVNNLSDLLNQSAPDFSLIDWQNQTVKLSELRGKKVVLFFNEGLMCYPACWNQVAALGNDPRFKTDDIVAFSVVVDPREQWGQAIERLPALAPARVLFDTGRVAANSYGVLNLPSSMHPGALPGHTYVVIDKEGIVRYVKDDPMMGLRNDELITELAKLL